jgi:hypothetical protein
VKQIDNKAKNISAVTKSKIDWKNYTKENNLTRELARNRMDGYIGKKQFLEKIKENTKQKSNCTFRNSTK